MSEEQAYTAGWRAGRKQGFEEGRAALEEPLRDLLSLFPGHDEAKRLAEKWGLDVGSVAIVERARAVLGPSGGEE